MERVRDAVAFAGVVAALVTLILAAAESQAMWASGAVYWLLLILTLVLSGETEHKKG